MSDHDKPAHLAILNYSDLFMCLTGATNEKPYFLHCDEETLDQIKTFLKCQIGVLSEGISAVTAAWLEGEYCHYDVAGEEEPYIRESTRDMIRLMGLLGAQINSCFEFGNLVELSKDVCSKE